jgi:spore maturation protein CgeB
MLKGLHGLGHRVTFFERDVAYYAAHRDLSAPEFCELVLYEDWTAVLPRARQAIADADVAMVTSYCPDGIAASEELLDKAAPLRVFYDMDTPITLAGLEGTGVDYVQMHMLPEFDLVLSFTGGPILEELQTRWGAKRTAALYGSVDPEVHVPVDNPPRAYRCALGYLGTYSADRQPSLERMLLQPARARPTEQFMVVGSLYPPDIDWPGNVRTQWHLDPNEHPAFYSANRLTLSVTRQAMREWGYTPSGRLFEAASCGTPVLTDSWPGLDTFFEPGTEILVADDASEVERALERPAEELHRIGQAARERTLAQHTGKKRAQELLTICEAASC